MARSPKTPTRRRSKALVELFPHLGSAPEGPPGPNAAAETLKEMADAIHRAPTLGEGQKMQLGFIVGLLRPRSAYLAEYIHPRDRLEDRSGEGAQRLAHRRRAPQGRPGGRGLRREQGRPRRRPRRRPAAGRGRAPRRAGAHLPASRGTRRAPRGARRAGGRRLGLRPAAGGHRPAREGPPDRPRRPEVDGEEPRGAPLQRLPRPQDPAHHREGLPGHARAGADGRGPGEAAARDSRRRAQRGPPPAHAQRRAAPLPAADREDAAHQPPLRPQGPGERRAGSAGQLR